MIAFPPYNSSSSASYKPSDEKVGFMVPGTGAFFAGNFSRETIAIGDLSFENQEFVEMLDARAEGFLSMYSGFNGVLGLAPKTKEKKLQDLTSTNVSSSWESFTSSKKLDRNMFSLTLPSEPQTPPTYNLDHTGELVFGGLPEGCKEEDAIKLPLKKNSPVWATSLESFTIEGDFNTTFENGTAIFSTSNILILFPHSVAKHIGAHVGEYETINLLTAFNCTKRDTLPDLTFGIGSQKITIKSDQYTWKTTFSDEVEKCFIGLRKEDNFKNTIALGTTFLKNYKTAFDQDSEQVLLWPYRQESAS